MIKRIERPDWNIFDYGDGVSTSSLDGWFTEHVEPINKALDEATVVYGWPRVDPEEGDLWSSTNREDDTHKGLLINIEPIKKDTAEDVLREIVDGFKGERGALNMKLAGVLERAEEVLGRSK